ncbi:MAG: hypothetical protein ACOCW7_04020 [Bacteroidota bacterium]
MNFGSVGKSYFYHDNNINTHADDYNQATRQKPQTIILASSI